MRSVSEIVGAAARAEVVNSRFGIPGAALHSVASLARVPRASRVSLRATTIKEKMMKKVLIRPVLLSVLFI